jgi:hypothetical protein
MQIAYALLPADGVAPLRGDGVRGAPFPLVAPAFSFEGKGNLYERLNGRFFVRPFAQPNAHHALYPQILKNSILGIIDVKFLYNL